MTAIAYGSKYDATQEMSTTQIAKLIRADIKALKLPKGFKFSVRTEYFAGGSAIRIEVTRVPEGFPVLDPKRREFLQQKPHAFCRHPMWAPKMQQLIEKLEALHRSYNFDGSDSQSDYFHVRYYGTVCVDHALREDAG